MTDIVLEIVRAALLAGIVVFLLRAGRGGFHGAQAGWNWIVVGFSLLLFASLLDITDNFEALNRFQVVGDTPTEAFLEKFVGFLGGFAAIAVGLVKWIPAISRQAEERTRNLVDAVSNLHDAIGIFDADERLVFCNDEFRRLRPAIPDLLVPGARFEDLLRENIRRGGNDDAVADVETYIQERLRSFRNPGEPFVRSLKDGSWVLVKEGRTLDGGTYSTSTDITSLKEAEAALRESEERFRKIFEISAAGILLTEPAGVGRIIQANPAMCDMVGYTEAELTTMTTLDITHPDDRADMVARRQAQADEKQGSLPFVKRYLHKSGRQVWVRGTTSVVRDAGGGIRYILGLIQDITDFIRAEEALKESEQRFRDFAEVASDWFWEMDSDLRFSDFSGRNLDVTGLELDDLIGKTRQEVTEDDITSDHWRGHLADLEARRPFHDFQYQMRGAGERNIHISISGKPIIDSDGTFKGYRGTGTDISARVAAQEAVRASEALLKGAVENMQEGFALYGADDRLVVCNDEYRRLHPASRHLLKPGALFEDIVRNNVESGMVVEAAGDPEDFIRRRMEKHRNPGEPIMRELSDGTWKIVKESRAPDGSTAITETDITELKRIEKMKSEFISTVSHELRTPLTSIHGSLGLVASGVAGAVPEEVERLVEIAESNSRRLINLVNDILDLEKIESGKMEFRFDVVDMAAVVNDAIEANQSYAEEFETTFRLGKSAADATVLGDKDRLIQVMSNLMSNAAKFSPPGTPVDIAVARRDGVVRVSVADSGPGIAEEFHHRLFDRFCQADGSDSRQVGGTGLGLNISKAIVDKHGGDIAFDTKLGRGSTFYFDIPLWRQT